MNFTPQTYQISLLNNDSDERSIYEFTTSNNVEYNIFLFPYPKTGYFFFEAYPELETDKTVQFDFSHNSIHDTYHDKRISASFCKFIFELFNNEPQLILYFTTSEDVPNKGGKIRRTAKGRAKLFSLWHKEYEKTELYKTIKLTFKLLKLTDTNKKTIYFGYLIKDNNPHLKLLQDWEFSVLRLFEMK